MVKYLFQNQGISGTSKVEQLDNTNKEVKIKKFFITNPHKNLKITFIV